MITGIEPKLDRKSMTLMHTTEAGKELHLVTHAASSNKVFQWSGGGEVPRKLQGLFTDVTSAKNAMQRWIADKPSPTLSPETKPEATEPSAETPPSFIDNLLSAKSSV